MKTLDAYLIQKELSDEAFAEMAGCHRTRINRIRHGKAMPSLELATRIERLTDGQVSASSFVRAA